MGRTQVVSRRSVGDRNGSRRATAALLVTLLLVVAGCSKGGGSRPADGTGAASAGSAKGWKPAQPDTLGPVVATVAGRRITRHEVDSLILTAPLGMQAQLRQPDGYKEAINRLITEEIFFRAARQEGVEKDSTYLAELEKNRRLLMMRRYYDIMLAKAPSIPEDTLRAYYDRHPDEFTIMPRARVRHIQLASKSKAQQVRRELVKGAPWDATVSKYSTHQTTKPNGGMIGWVTRESEIVPGIGKAPAITEAAFTLAVDKVSQPLQVDKNWHLLKVEERQDRTVQPYEAVNERLRARLQNERRDTYSKELSDSLKQYFNATVFEDSILTALKPNKTASDYFKEAQAATTPIARIELYRELVGRFPQDSVSVQAKFMIGFTYAEEMGEYEMAKKEFEEFLRVYPDAELAGSAKWMLENMEKPAPTLEENAPPEGGEKPPTPDVPPPGPPEGK
ncbi:MAG TPA: peptidyl-prolyl cis-trans isomerase [Candidatus Eisenbacteria bacterium]|nr:peptidyl-prolyl cis-trans isomerase [Candidatus Eisenbacteria bacterium]